MSMFNWEVVDRRPGRPWHRTSGCPGARPSGIGAQHVVAMFGATFVFPLVMGLDPNLAIMFSRHLHDPVPADHPATRCPSYLGTSASFVGGVAAIRAQGGDSADVTGAILVAGVVLARWSACSSTSPAPALIHKILPPAVTGAVVMLIGFNLARRGQHLLAAGPVGRAAHRDRS